MLENVRGYSHELLGLYLFWCLFCKFLFGRRWPWRVHSLQFTLPSRETKQTQTVNTYVWRQMFWRVSVFQDHLHGLEVLLFFLYDTAPAVPVLSGSPESQANDRCGLYDGPGAAAERRAAASGSPDNQAAAASPSTVEHQFYKLVSTFLQDGDLRQPGYPERQMICNKMWCSPFGAENPSCRRRMEKEHQTFLCCNVRLFWGFFCSFMHIFLIWIQAWCHLPSLPQCICWFSHALIISRTNP